MYYSLEHWKMANFPRSWERDNRIKPTPKQIAEEVANKVMSKVTNQLYSHPNNQYPHQ